MKLTFPFSALTTIVVTLVSSASVSAQDATISANDPRLTRFADQIVDFSPATPANLNPAVADPSAALGAPNSGSTGAPNFNPVGLVSLGDAPSGQAPGSITLGFSSSIVNGVGGDFAVFENASNFGSASQPSLFVELAFVQVSTDGISFAQFDTLSLITLPDNDDSTPPLDTDLLLDFSGGFDFATIPDRSLVSGFAGADLANTGTLFDLEALSQNALVLDGSVNLNAINFVRLIDVVGDGRFVDSSGNQIFDAFSPGNATGGFDLDAIGVVSAVPEPGSLVGIVAIGVLLSGRRRTSNSRRNRGRCC